MIPEFNFRLFDKIQGLKFGDKFWGLHIENLEVAQLDSISWEALGKGTNQVARQELVSWNFESSASKTANQPLIESVDELNTLVINVSQLCNLGCKYCAAGGDGTYGSSKGKVDLAIAQKQIQAFCEKIPDNGTFFINFFGGEPLLHPEAIKSLTTFATLHCAPRRIQLCVAVVTNGTLINQEIALFFAKYNFKVIVSIDGPESINDKLRPKKNGKGSTADTIKGINFLQKIRSKLAGFQINSVFGQNNTNVLETYNYVNQFAPDNMSFIFDMECSEILSNEKFVEQMALVAEAAFKENGESQLRKIAVFDDFFRQLDSQKHKKNHCGAGKNMVVSDTEGNVYACPWMNGDETKQIGTEGQINANAQKIYLKNHVDHPTCEKCWARNICGGGCMKELGINKESLLDRDDLLNEHPFCFRTKHLIAIAVQYYGLSRLR